MRVNPQMDGLKSIGDWEFAAAAMEINEHNWRILLPGFLKKPTSVEEMFAYVSILRQRATTHLLLAAFFAGIAKAAPRRSSMSRSGKIS